MYEFEHILSCSTSMSIKFSKKLCCFVYSKCNMISINQYDWMHKFTKHFISLLNIWLAINVQILWLFSKKGDLLSHYSELHRFHLRES